MNSDEQTDPEVPSLSFKEENYHYLDILTFTSIYHVFIWDIKSIYPILVNDVLFASGLLLQFLLPLSVQINYHKDKPIFCGRIGKETSAINTEKKNAFVSGEKKNLFFLEMGRKVAEYSTVWESSRKCLAEFQVFNRCFNMVASFFVSL